MQNEFINYKGLNIAHINTRSLLSKKDSLQIYLDNSNLSILCISETWLNRHIPDNLTYFRGYNIIRNDRKVLNVNGQTKNGGGVAILIQKDLACDCITMADTNTSNKDAELLNQLQYVLHTDPRLVMKMSLQTYYLRRLNWLVEE